MAKGRKKAGVEGEEEEEGKSERTEKRKKVVKKRTKGGKHMAQKLVEKLLTAEATPNKRIELSEKILIKLCFKAIAILEVRTVLQK